MPNTEINSSNPLVNRYWKNSQITPETTKSALESLNAIPVKTPAQIVDVSKDAKDSIEILDSRVRNIIATLDIDTARGNKAISMDGFRKEMIINWMGNYPVNPELDEYFADYIGRVDRAPKGLWRKSLNFFDQTREQVGLSAVYGVGLAGQVISKVHKSAGKKLTEFPISYHLANDITSIVSSDVENKASKVEELSHRYNRSIAETSSAAHPDFTRRLIAASSLIPAYNVTRQVAGWGSFGGLLVLPTFRDAIDQNPEAVTALAGLFLAGSMAVRMATEYKTMERLNFNADALQVLASNLTGTIDESGNLKANPKATLYATPLDVLVSSLPPYGLAFVIDAPYSVSAYLCAMGIDQIGFATVNGLLNLTKKGAKNAS